MEKEMFAPSPDVRQAVPPVLRDEREPLRVGYALLAISFIIFVMTDLASGGNEENLLTIFFAHYIVALCYAGYLLYKRAFGIRRSWKPANIHNTIALLNLFLISAYALNRVVVVFQDSTTWLCVLLMLGSICTLSFRFFDVLPRWVNRLQYVTLGSTIILFVYLSFFVSGYYVFGFIGTLAMGIGAHIFVPLFMIAGAGFLARASRAHKRVSLQWITLGAAIVTAIGVAFVSEWTLRVGKIEKLANQTVLLHDTQLPSWVAVGQEITNDWISQRILKSDLVYTTSPEQFSDWEFFPSRGRWSEAREHDPLVFLATMKSRTTLSEDDRIKILKAISNARHSAEERLWSGEHLTTSYVVTDVDIYPDVRIAYTEKYFNIRNNDGSQRPWRNGEEALYTFQLSEGSVVTSLSLWINGEEEKGVLTSKQKADSAYKQIVGVEARDPSVVHWQEGNTVTVRVFPCTNKEERKFKIGITSPLTVENGKVVYRNIAFSGPDPSDANATTRVRIRGNATGVNLSRNFTQNNNAEYIAEHPYDPDLTVSFDSRPVPPNDFTFAGNTYSVNDYMPAWESVPFEALYLDVNNTWSTNELETVQPLLDAYKVFVYHNNIFLAATNENWKVLSQELLDKNFSLFPFHLIKDTNSSLVITKGDIFTPHLVDVRESAFSEGIRDFARKRNKLRVFNFKGGSSTYINSLREFRAFTYYSGTQEDLKAVTSQKKFIKSVEGESAIVIGDASMVITKRPAGEKPVPNTAPDHVARLFAYNDIMRRIGADYAVGNINESLVQQASSAYVVSPVSSLVVLESGEDYERFNIKDKGESLKNASRDSSGAVPEPHEWALIVMFVLFVIYVKLRS